MPPQRSPDPDPVPPSPVASLPPESRFAVHALAEGATVEEIAALMQLPAERVETHLRSAARRVSGSSPPPSSGRSALLQALDPTLESIRSWQATGGSPVSGDDVRLGPWAGGRLDGPLLLATLEWAGDDPVRLRRGLELHRDPSLAQASPPPPRARGGCLGGTAVLIALIVGGYALVTSS